MATLNLTYSEANKAWVKSLGHWFTDDGTRRVPRYFRFPYPNSDDGRRKAEGELLPLLNQWQQIKAAAKKAGVPPVWYRPTIKPVKANALVAMAVASAPEPPVDEDDAEAMEAYRQEVASSEATKAKTEKAKIVERNVKANEDADPAKALPKASIEQAKEAFCKWYEGTGVKSYTARGTAYALRAVLKGLDATQPMMSFDAAMVVDGLLARVASGKLKARSAHNYAQAIRLFCEWYAKQTKTYELHHDWKEMFVKRRFRNPGKGEAVFTEDAEEADFEVYSKKDLKTILSSCSTDRQKLYVLLALNGAMYYVDIAHALRTKNVHLDRKRPFLLYRREKESHHPNPIIQKVWLWEETAKLLKKEMNTGGKHPQALLNENGEPMDKIAVRSSWVRVKNILKSKKLLPHRKTIRFTDLRKTGSTEVSNLSSTDLGNLHLGHKVEGVGSKYIKLQKKRLYSPLMKWERALKAAGVF